MRPGVGHDARQRPTGELLGDGPAAGVRVGGRRRPGRRRAADERGERVDHDQLQDGQRLAVGARKGLPALEVVRDLLAQLDDDALTADELNGAAAANAASPFAYRLDNAGNAYSFVPTRTRDASGQSIAAVPLLDPPGP